MLGNNAALSTTPDQALAGSMRALDWRAFEAPNAREAWDALAQRASEPNPFYESWYCLPSLRALDPQGDVVLLRFQHDGRMAGLMPLVRPKRYYRWPLPHLGNWVHSNCFLGAPLVTRGAERPFWLALLDWADRQGGRALFLHLRSVPLSGPLFDSLATVLKEQARPGGLVWHEERAMLSSDLAPAAYLEAAMSGKKRKELRRQSARLGELGTVSVERTSAPEGLPDWIDRFLALEASGWKGAAGSALASHRATESLFREAMAGAAARGRLDRLSLLLNGEPIAMLATFRTPPGAYSYKTAFDERFSRYSPGVLLQRENLETLAQTDIDWTDSCAAADHPMIDHIWRERRGVGHLSIAIGGPLRHRVGAMLLRAERALPITEPPVTAPPITATHPPADD